MHLSMVEVVDVEVGKSELIPSRQMYNQINGEKSEMVTGVRGEKSEMATSMLMCNDVRGETSEMATSYWRWWNR